jgi:hypothetical protein
MCAVHAMKNVMGFNFLGVTTDMALRLPFFRHYLGWIGTITASSHVVMKHVCPSLFITTSKSIYSQAKGK